MRRLPLELEQEILRRAFQGETYRQISDELNVSLATVNRVFEDARKRMPDIDSARELSNMLRKTGLRVFDATRAGKLMESLNKWGISLQELEDYVRLNERLLSEKALGEDALAYAVRLMQLEQSSGQTCQELVKSFEKMQIETAELEDRKANLENEIRELKTDVTEAKTNLAEAKSEIEKATTARKGLAEIGIDKLALMVGFVEDFESLGFDGGQVQKLAVWYQELKELNIDPANLGKYIAERGPLQTQNINLKHANKRIEAEVNTQVSRRENLMAENSALQAVNQALRTRTLTMYCKSCRTPLQIALPTREFYYSIMNTGQVLSAWCPTCGLQQAFTPWEIAVQIAWIILPTDTPTILVIEHPA